MMASSPPNSSRSPSLEIRHEQRALPDLGRHMHGHHQIVVSLSGDADIDWWTERFGSQHIRSRHQDLIINPANALHSTNWTGAWDRIFLNLDSQLVASTADELDIRDDFELQPAAKLSDATISHLALTLFQDLRNDPLACTLYAETVASLLAIRLLRCLAGYERPAIHPPIPLTEGQMAIVDAYILGNLDREVSVAKLASLLGLGPVHFFRRLKARNGLSPYQYVTNKRIHRACELLGSSKRSIAEIGFEVGFSGQSHFSARFKQVVGATPREYRKLRQNN